MAKVPEWEQSDDNRLRLYTELLSLYIDPHPLGGYHYRVAAHYLLRYTLKPIATIEEAKRRCLKAALKLLSDEKDVLAKFVE